MSECLANYPKVFTCATLPNFQRSCDYEFLNYANL